MEAIEVPFRVITPPDAKPGIYSCRCRGSGALLAEHKELIGLWAFSCGCGSGPKRPYHRWENSHHRKFVIVQSGAL